MTSAELDECLRALSHRERRQFYLACAANPMAAGDLAETSQLALASVSEHLKVLRKAGLIDVQKNGRFWIYRAVPARFNQVVAALDALRRHDGT